MGDLLGGLEAGVDDGDSDHPDTVLDAGRQHCDFGEKSLVCRTSHYLVRVPFRAAVWPDDDDGRAEILNEVPAGASDGKDIGIVTDIAEELEGGVVLEEEIHFNANAANVLEHTGELHVFRI